MFQERNRMQTPKFIELDSGEKNIYVKTHFKWREGGGWYTEEGVYGGKNIDDVITALIEFEDAEINAIGDCMTGFCQVQPRFEDFVIK